MEIGNLGLGGLDQAELQRRVAQYQSGIGSVPAPTKAVAPRPTPTPYRGGPSAPGFGPKTTPVPYATPVTPKPTPAITDNRATGVGAFIPEPSSTPNSATATAPATNSFVAATGTSPSSGLQDYRDKILSGGADYFEIDDVDEVDDYYDNAYEKAFGSIPGLNVIDTIGGEGGVGGGQVDYNPTRNLGDEEYRSFVSDVPEYLKGFKQPAKAEDTRNAYGSIAEVSGAGDTSAVLSSHYGYDITPMEAETRKFGGNLGEHTTSSTEELSEFQSLVRPILKEQIPYLQATEGLDYQDALMEAYKRDPMLQSLYAKYDVTPIRQTKDGSTYLYDPMTYSEVRTKEVKDSSVKDALKMAAIVAASFYGGSFLANAFSGAGAGAAGATGATGATATGATAAGATGATAGAAGAAGAATGAATGAGASLGATIAGNAASSAIITAATGGDMNDILKAAATAGLTSGVGAYAEGLNTAAETARVAAEGAEKGSTLFKAAEAAKNTADTFNRVVNTGKFIARAVDGDVASAVIGQFGEKFTTAALDKVGLKGEFLAKYNINQDDLTSGLVKTQMELAKGTDFDNALVRGFGEYIKEGGALAPNDLKTPEFIKRIGDAIAYTGKMFDDTIFEPVKDATQPAIDAAKAMGKKFDDNVFEPAKETVEAAGKKIDDKIIEPVLDPIKAAGSAVDDAVIQPVREALKDIDKPEGVDTPNLGISLSDILQIISGGGAGVGGAGVRGGTPGIVTEESAPLFKLAKEEEGQKNDISNFLASLTGNNPVVNVASGGMIQSSYGDLFDTIHQPKQTSDSTLNELLRIVGSK